MTTFAHRTMLPAAALLILGAADAGAQWQRRYEPVGQVRFRLGIFEPAGGSGGWDRVFEGFTGSPSDLKDLVGGTEFLWRTGRRSGVLFGFSYYSGATTSSYEDWVAGDGSEVRHTTRFTLSDLTAAWVYRFGEHGVRPYAGIGAGLLWWTLADEGYFIDFGAPNRPVYWAWYGARGTAFEAFGLIGLDIPLTPRWSVFVEGRYRYGSDELGDDFSGFGTIDLSGYEVTGGFAVSF